MFRRVFVNDLIVLRRETGSLEPKRQGNRGRNGKYQGVEVWLRSRVSECGELTLDELRVELERECGMAFAKLKALIRKHAARTYDQLWKAVGAVCELFSDEECFNFFEAAGYEGY